MQDHQEARPEDGNKLLGVPDSAGQGGRAVLLLPIPMPSNKPSGLDFDKLFEVLNNHL